ncbi:hypothetical protein PR001_g23649 [Phytophthora rubi]|uniref:Uncharacterized protein n=2 Tax=Phytophthora rubi TaxID=129364 RepID=A0A6A3IKX1_9STRA|nr:hypothetical protein PR001_g23649 [Phytophthora rubi]
MRILMVFILFICTPFFLASVTTADAVGSRSCGTTCTCRSTSSYPPAFSCCATRPSSFCGATCSSCSCWSSGTSCSCSC